MSDVENHAVIMADLEVCLPDGTETTLKVDTLANEYLIRGRVAEVPAWQSGENTTYEQQYEPVDWVDWNYYVICGDSYQSEDTFIKRIASYDRDLKEITEDELSGVYVAHRNIVLKQGFTWEEYLVVYTRQIEFDENDNEVPKVTATLIYTEFHSVSRWQ